MLLRQKAPHSKFGDAAMTASRNLTLSLSSNDDTDDSSYASLASTAGLDGGGGDVSASVALHATLGASTAQTMTLYLTEAGDSSAISVNDLHQGQIGDCFLISSIGELALNDPTAISNMIHVNANGTETVTLHEAANGQLASWNTTAFRTVTETVTNVFPNYAVNNGATQDVLGNQKEIWPQVLEKAVAQLDGGYSDISNGGSPLVAMETLTGHATSYTQPAALTLTALLADVKAGDLIVMDTPNSNSLPNGLVGDHAYMFEGVTGTGSSAMVHLGNPWGFDQPTAISFSQLSKGIAEVDIGHVS
jgi:hypothetical protein